MYGSRAVTEIGIHSVIQNEPITRRQYAKRATLRESYSQAFDTSQSFHL